MRPLPCLLLASLAASACGGAVVTPGATGAGGASSSAVTTGAGGSGAASSSSTSAAGGAASCTADLASDASNCGRCGHSCEGGACVSGACERVTFAAGGAVDSIALHPAWIYWSDPQGHVRRVARGGAAAVEDVAGGCGGLVTGGDVVDGRTGANGICQLSVTSGAAPPLIGEAGFTWQLAADASAVYYARGKNLAVELVAAPWLGAATHLADVALPPFEPGPDEPGGVFLALAHERLLAVYPGTHDDGNGWYRSDGLAVSYRLPDGPLTVLASGLSRPWRAATDGVDAYWVAYGDDVSPSAVWKAPIDGGAPELVASAVQGKIDRFAVDATDVWLARGVDLLRAPKDGSEPPTPVAGGLVNSAFAVDEAAVVWAESGPGGDDAARIVVLAK